MAEIINEKANSKRVKLGICEWCLPVDTSIMCETVAELGLHGVELNLGKEWKASPLSNSAIQKKYLEKAKECGISFPTLGINSLCIFGMSKAENKEIIKEIFIRAVDIALSMGIMLLQVPSFGNGSIYSEEDFKNTIECLNYACSISEKYNIVIATENALSWKENMSIIKQVDYDNIKVYFDTQNPYVVNGYNVAEMVDHLSPYICEIHAKDGKNGIMGNSLLGDGEASIIKTMDKIKKYNYEGWILLENEYSSKELIRHDVNVLMGLML